MKKIILCFCIASCTKDVSVSLPVHSGNPTIAIRQAAIPPIYTLKISVDSSSNSTINGMNYDTHQNQFKQVTELLGRTLNPGQNVTDTIQPTNVEFVEFNLNGVGVMAGGGNNRVQITASDGSVRIFPITFNKDFYVSDSLPFGNIIVEVKNN